MRWLMVIGVLVTSIAASVTGGDALRAAAPAASATPAPLPPSRDTTVPRGPVQTVQRGNQTVQVQPIRRVQTADGHEAVADRIIVGFRPGVSDAEKNAVGLQVAAAQRGVSPIPLKRVNTNAQYIDVSGAPSLDTAIQAYRADPRVAYAEPDGILRATGTPNDPLFTNQYGMVKIQAPTAWGLTTGSAAVKIAVLDCGIYEAHPDLAGKVLARQDFTGSASGTDDQCDHGTHVAGIASADKNNGIGVAGVGYNTSLLNGKILGDDGSGDYTWVAAGIQWAADNGANVINMSLGGFGGCSQTLQDAVDYAWARNVVIVAAAGNDGANERFQPADCTHVVAVASTDSVDAKSSFSNFGTWVSVAAPGSTILSSLNPNINNGTSYGYLSGTSMASPHVAGLAGLLWATGWGTSAQAIVNRLESTADAIPGTGTDWQFGRINVATAIGPPPSLLPAQPSPPASDTRRESRIAPRASAKSGRHRGHACPIANRTAHCCDTYRESRIAPRT